MCNELREMNTSEYSSQIALCRMYTEKVAGMMAVVGSDKNKNKNRGSAEVVSERSLGSNAKRCTSKVQTWMNAYVLPRILKMRIPSRYIVIGGIEKDKGKVCKVCKVCKVRYAMYVTCEDGSGERSSRGPSRHRGCRKTGLEGTCGLGGGRGNSRGKSKGTFHPSPYAMGDEKPPPPTYPQNISRLTIRFPAMALYTRTGRQSKMKIPPLNKAAAARRGAKNLAVRGVTESPTLYLSSMYLQIV